MKNKGPVHSSILCNHCPKPYKILISTLYFTDYSTTAHFCDPHTGKLHSGKSIHMHFCTMDQTVISPKDGESSDKEVFQYFLQQKNLTKVQIQNINHPFPKLSIHNCQHFQFHLHQINTHFYIVPLTQTNFSSLFKIFVNNFINIIYILGTDSDNSNPHPNHSQHYLHALYIHL